jgi:predicted transcriptional regulator
MITFLPQEFIERIGELSLYEYSVNVSNVLCHIAPEEHQQIKRFLRDKLELKLVPDENVKIGIAMNEKIAGIAFPDLKGKMDFNSGFTSSSIDFHKWCCDLFSFYWNGLKKLL